ncbi:hypothetical protein FNV43_RR00564 [Rhamnella rubrinervis]|uniref:Uncharacterized protein n=1 Tax=Rhamnella rubrinervis TaxID=2594499 RepID=A0A8K0HNU5_9ROSA|nr:hypothetical protein FNV43_RR00564 [Rhamnella rubrinervis]
MARYHLLPDLKPLAPTQMLGKDLLIGISDSGRLSFLPFCNEMHRSGSVKFLETFSLTCWKLRCVGHSILYIWLETLRLGTKGGKAKNAEPADEVLKKAQALFLDRLSELVNASSLQKIHHSSLLVVGLEEKDKWWKEVPDQGLCRSGGFAQVYKAYVKNNPGEVVALNVMSNYIAYDEKEDGRECREKHGAESDSEMIMDSMLQHRVGYIRLVCKDVQTLDDGLFALVNCIHVSVQVYVDGTTTVSTHERRASIREFYAIIYPSLQQLQRSVTDTEDKKQKAVCMESTEEEMMKSREAKSNNIFESLRLTGFKT